MVENINLKIKSGEMFSLLGPSGCGKTTLLKILAGLLEADNGDIKIEGESIIGLSAENRNIVIVFQENRLFPHMTVSENIEFGLKIKKMPKKMRSEISKELLELVQLKEYGDKWPHQLSGGQKQRVALARALAVKPEVLLLDEPFSSLDEKLRLEMRSLVISLQKKLGITTILVTHDKEEALMISDRVALMMDGEIKQIGSPQELYEKPISAEVADYFGEKNYINGIVKNGIFHCDFFNIEMPKPFEMKVLVMVKPEDIEIDNKIGELNATIVERQYAGNRWYYKIYVNNKNL
ncbi:MAG: ABC transporter ATP-binding protein, partial [Fusobacteriaceae bacterium]|nr:ABC transporter ATP-binding protein [Fusobacteriaceae bacterium]